MKLFQWGLPAVQFWCFQLLHDSKYIDFQTGYFADFMQDFWPQKNNANPLRLTKIQEPCIESAAQVIFNESINRNQKIGVSS